MPQSFFAADLHIGHRGVCNFLAPDGMNKLRPWDNPDEMDEALIEKWNAKVKPDDKVYVAGDVVINRKALHKVGRLNGKKHLVKGNHDIFRVREYLEYFYEVSACRVFNDFILTHIPLHPSCLGRFGTNVHGHLHAHKVTVPGHLTPGDEWIPEHPDPRYICVSLEQINFEPIHIDELRLKIKQQKETYAS